ncbi:asparaginase [Kitasatospora sp. NBC_00240]|uniref:asparaginase n=1 Tax=Kitasatospora sp. NBC_00240 TaxID=2903567 RepID=UPI00225BC9B0|nr:asparaginase [Kitasatospora sp. NBC_00240]MCX5215387.1 asparaginase [Kitasatospora sp. NBC_00240]
MGRVVMVSTGGTIASRRQEHGYAAEARGHEVLGALAPPGAAVEVLDLFTLNSAHLTTANQLTLLHTVHAVLTDPDVDGIVVTHGTDTLEESAFLLDLYHRDRRPVVFTGAQRPLDDPDGDAQDNLRDAVLAAETLRDQGVLVVFDGLVHAARGTVKTQTLARAAFADPSGRRIGLVKPGRVVLERRAERPVALPLPVPGTSSPRVDVVMHHCDGDPLLLEVAVAAGARGIVLAATGAGNATPAMVEAVSRAVSAGVLVALTTRVAAGPVTPLYTGGGAVDLIAAGAVPTGVLRAAQARIAVLAALLADEDPVHRVAVLRQVLHAAAP